MTLRITDSLRLNIRVYPIFEKSFLSSSKCYRLLNLTDLFSEFHIVFLLSKPLNQASCMKSKKAFGYNLSTGTTLHSASYM